MVDPQEGADASQLGPGYVAILVSVTDAGLGGKLHRAFQGISTPQAIASSALTSALAHPEDAAVASFNLHVCGSDKVSNERTVSARIGKVTSGVVLIVNYATRAKCLEF